MATAGQAVSRRLSARELVPAGLMVLVWIVMLLWTPGSTLRDDPFRFMQIATSRGTPYRDFPVEYPPLETVLVLLIGKATPLGVALRVALVNAFSMLGCWWLLRRHWSPTVGVLFLWFSLPLQLFMPFRVDAVSYPFLMAYSVPARAALATCI